MIREDLPIVSVDADIMGVINAITRSSLGLAIVQNQADWAVITDGDVRRAVEAFGKDVFQKTAGGLMSLDPARVSVGTRVEDALVLMERRRISALLVFDHDRLVGVFKK
jgi:arabinose-5-phosphate isomerase